MKKTSLIIFVSVLALAGCRRTVACGNQYVTPVFVGFPLSDLDTLVVREFTKGDNFSTLLDTAVIVTGQYDLVEASSHDTTVVLFNYISGEERYLFPDHDWQIIVPAQNLVISLSGFDSPTLFKKCTLGGDLCPACANPINSFLQNNELIVPRYGKSPFSGDSLYLTYIHPG